MLTHRGIVLLVSAGALYGIARIASIDELYPLAAGAVAFPIVASAFVRWTRFRVSFSRSLGPRRVFAGGTVRFVVRARNEGRFRSPPLVVEDALPARLGQPVRLDVPPLHAGGEQRFEAARRPGARGRFTIGPLRARLVDPLGLAELSAEVGPAATITVYPSIESLHGGGPPASRGGSGRSRARRLSRAGDEFHAVRDWQEGDDLRKIHWRTTARRGSLQIRQDEVHSFPRTTIFLDSRPEGHRAGERGSSFEWAVSAAASVVWELAAQGYTIRLATPETSPQAERRGREAADPLLTSLALMRVSRRRTLDLAVRDLASGGGALLAIMPPPEPEALPALVRAARAYRWRGAILLDALSFAGRRPRERALYDRSLAEAERVLIGAGWRVVVAGASDRIGERWHELRSVAGSRPGLPLRHS